MYKTEQVVEVVEAADGEGADIAVPFSWPFWPFVLGGSAERMMLSEYGE
jgi:hypothetical protein